MTNLKLIVNNEHNKQYSPIGIPLLQTYREISDLNAIISQENLPDKFKYTRNSVKKRVDTVKYYTSKIHYTSRAYLNAVKERLENNKERSYVKSLENIKKTFEYEKHLPELKLQTEKLKTQSKTKSWKRKAHEKEVHKRLETNKVQDTIYSLKNLNEELTSINAIVDTLLTKATKGKGLLQKATSLKETMDKKDINFIYDTFKSTYDILEENIIETWFNNADEEIIDKLKETNEIKELKQIIVNEIIDNYHTLKNRNMNSLPMSVLNQSQAFKNLKDHMNSDKLHTIQNALEISSLKIRASKSNNQKIYKLNNQNKTEKIIAELNSNYMNSKSITYCLEKTKMNSNILTRNINSILNKYFRDHAFIETKSKTTETFKQIFKKYSSINKIEDAEGYFIHSFIEFYKKQKTHSLTKEILDNKNIVQKTKSMMEDFIAYFLSDVYYKQSYNEDKDYQGIRNSITEDLIKKDSLESLKIYNHLTFLMDNAKESYKKHISYSLSSKNLKNTLSIENELILDWARSS